MWERSRLLHTVKECPLILFSTLSIVFSGLCYFINLKSFIVSNEAAFLISISFGLIVFFFFTSKENGRITSLVRECINTSFFVILEIKIILSLLGITIPEKLQWFMSVTAITLGLISLWSLIEKTSIPNYFLWLRPALILRKIKTLTKHFKNLEILFILIVIPTSLFFSSRDLGKFITRDEPRWVNYFQQDILSPSNIEESTNNYFINKTYGRTVGYWNSYFSGNLPGTLVINAGSGIMTSVLELPSYFFQNRSIEAYLFVSRISFVLFNTLLIVVGAYILKKILNVRFQALLFLSLLALNPMFIGFSRIVNHDSITGILVAIFFLSLLAALKYNGKPFFVLSGILYGCAVLTSGKAAFAPPLLWLSPIIYSLAFREEIPSDIFRKNLFWVFISSLLPLVLFLPASIQYPDLIVSKLLLPTGFLTIPTFFLIVLSWVEGLDKYKKALIGFLYHHERYLIRIGILILLVAAIYVLRNIKQIISLGALSEASLPFSLAVAGTAATFFYSLPIIIVLLLGIWCVYYFFKPKIDFSTTLMFFFFGLMTFLVLGSYKLSTLTAAGVEGTDFLVVYKRYQMTGLVFFFIALSSAKLWHIFNNKVLLVIINAVVLIMGIVNSTISPDYIFFMNQLFPQNQIPYPYSWGIGIYQAAQYINKLSLQKEGSNVTVFDPYGTGYRFFDKNRVALVDLPIQAEYIIVNNYAPGSYNEEVLSREIIAKRPAIWSYTVNEFNAVSIFHIK